jgi:indole-3-glycerol phosphate synthase
MSVPNGDMGLLDRIARDVRSRLEARQSSRDGSRLREAARCARRPANLREALSARVPQIIAEVKLRSPSEGVIAAGLDPVQVAHDYLAHGASALSILTEEDHFGGHASILAASRERFPQAYLLMKDFIIDEEQLFEARLNGADAVLLIVALLGEKRSGELLNACRELGLSGLVEVHDESEMHAAARIGADLIGVNNRDLKTLKVSLDVSRRLAPHAPKSATLVAESGLKTAADLLDLQKRGYSAFLIGTSFMRTGRPGLALAEMRRELS